MKIFENAIWLVFVFISVTKTNAQANEHADSLAKYYRANFAVPSQPAFNMLNSQSSDILRPTDIKDVSVIVSQFLRGTPSVIPKSYSVEIAPYLLARANSLKIGDFKKKGNRILSTVRLSIGTSLAGDGDARQSAFGVRFTPINRGDARFDSKFQNDLLLLLEQRQHADRVAVRMEGMKCEIADSICLARRNERIEAITDSLIGIAPTLNERINDLRDKYKKENWNSEKLDFAVALLATSPDSLVKNARFSRLSAWGTYAFPVKNWGQGLIGITGTTSKVDSLFTDVKDPVRTTVSSAALSARLYFGVNRIKGFFECQGKALTQSFELAERRKREGSLTGLLNLGGEASLNSTAWLEFNVGVLFSDQPNVPKSKLIGGFNLRFALPEQFKL